MSEKILKHVKAVYKCKDCRKKFTKRFIAGDLKEVSVAEIEPHVLANTPVSCKKCGGNNFEITYAFYHQEKLNHD